MKRRMFYKTSKNTISIVDKNFLQEKKILTQDTMDFWPETLFLEHSFQLWTDPNLINIIKHDSNNLSREMLQPRQSYYFAELRKKIRTMKVNENLSIYGLA